MKTMHKHFSRRCLLFLLTVSIAACGSHGSSHASGYGVKVKFSKGSVLHFPDFDLAYVGERHENSPKFPRGFTYQDFSASHGSETVKVSWSAGTGLIDAADFKIGGADYDLELRGSRKLGWLKENELVVNKK